MDTEEHVVAGSSPALGTKTLSNDRTALITNSRYCNSLIETLGRSDLSIDTRYQILLYLIRLEKLLDSGRVLVAELSTDSNYRQDINVAMDKVRSVIRETMGSLDKKVVEQMLFSAGGDLKLGFVLKTISTNQN